MSDPPQEFRPDTATGAENREHLRARFAALLLAQRPTSVLDVGCGSGETLRACSAAEVRAVGVEADAELVARAAKAGLDVRAARADRLPFPTASFDWVAIRHVLHHCDDARAVLGEALRVAGRGVVLAEPWLCPGVPSQELARRVDRWLKRQDRRLGRSHHEDLALADILALLPGHGSCVDVEIALRLRERPLSELDEEASARLEGLAESDPEREELAELRRAVAARGWTHNGSLIATIRPHSPTR